MKRFLLFAPGYLGALSSKTANGLIKFRTSEIVAVYDPSHAGQDVEQVLGYGGGIPILGEFQACLDMAVDTLVVGIAPIGGRLQEDWLPLLQRALEADLEIWSGLHDFLGDRSEFSAYRDRIWDLRRPPDNLRVASGAWRERKSHVLLTVGADSNIGKMTAALTLQQQLDALGVESIFVGTGQTGIAISGRGVAVDAVVSDFINGAIEEEISRVDGEAPLIIVEGQGALTHLGYSGVTAGLLHGAMPDSLLLVHQPSRRVDDYDLPLPDLDYLVRLHEAFLQPFSRGRVIGVSVYSKGLSEVECREEMAGIQRNLNLPVEDLVRMPTGRIAKELKEILLGEGGRER